MGLIAGLLGGVFGPGRALVRHSAERFIEGAGAPPSQPLQLLRAALLPPPPVRRSRLDGWLEVANRLPRPLLAFGTLGLFVAALVDPEWFASRMQGIALVPEPLWWLIGAVVSFYFGSRLQARGQEFRSSVDESIARVGQVSADLAALKALNQLLGAEDGDAPQASTGENAALAAWRAEQDHA